jgi:hypothetical protein
MDSETEKQAKIAQVIDSERINKDEGGEGQISLTDQALSVLKNTMNDPTASAAARSDAANKILSAMGRIEGKDKQIQALTRNELQAEIVRVRAMLAT